MSSEGTLFGLEAPLLLAGIDEAGRGPLAGPVCAAAVILNPEIPIAGLADSKVLSLKKRLQLEDVIRRDALAYCVAWASVEEIDSLNILQATLLAMTRAYEGLAVKPDAIVIDGNQVPRALRGMAVAQPKADRDIPAVSAASILAKNERDRLMAKYALEYPGYGFEQHAGYGTKAHIDAIRHQGVTPIHRRSFAPIKAQLMERGTLNPDATSQEPSLSLFDELHHAH